MTPSTTEPTVLVLGPVAIRDQKGNLAALSGQQAEVLCILAAAAPDPVRTDTLVDALWGFDAPPTAATGLRVVITRLRTKLSEVVPGASILAEAGHYRLTVHPELIDHWQFTSQTVIARDEMQQGLPSDAASRLRHTLAMWRGEPFQPYSDSEPIAAHTSRLDDERRDAEDLLIQALLESGSTDEAVARATEFVARDEFRESRWRLLMLGLYRAGRQAEALRTYQRMKRLYNEELGLEPGPSLQKLERSILDHDPALLLPTTPRSDQVGLLDLVDALKTGTTEPPAAATPLIGRDDDVSALSDLLQSNRLITVLGPPGVGKTRLAAHVAQTLVADPVLWLDLSATSSDGVVSELAAQLGIRVEPSLVLHELAATLRDEQTILIMDNCEHVVQTAAPLAEALVEACPGIRVLATSRIPFDSALETLFELKPLAPGDARRLLLERAFGSNSRPELDDIEVRRLVERLDRLPLAIELASGLLRRQDPGDVIRDLNRTSSVLTRAHSGDQRHGSLVSALQWSLNLLAPAERGAFNQLGTMSGPFHSAEFGAMLGVSESDGRSLLDHLAGHSLVSPQQHQPTPGYRVLETVRTFAREELVQDGNENEARSRHAGAYLELLEWAEPRWRGPDEERAVTRIGEAGPQLRAAFAWGLENANLDLAGRMAIAAWDHALLRMNQEQQGWSHEVLKRMSIEGYADGHLLLGTAAMSSWAHGDFDGALELADRATAVASTMGKPEPGSALRARMNVASNRFDADAAEQAAVALLDHSRAQHDTWERSAVMSTLAMGWTHLGEPALASATADKAFELANRTENTSAIAWAVHGQGFASLEVDPAGSLRLFGESLRLANSVRNRWVQGMATASSVTAHRRMAHHETAAALLADLIPHWQRGGLFGLLGNACREAALVLDALGRPDLAAAALRWAGTTGNSQPLLPQDEEALAILDSTKPARVEATHSSSEATQAEAAAYEVTALLQTALVELS